MKTARELSAAETTVVSYRRSIVLNFKSSEISLHEWGLSEP